jgi:hypothetical protein
VVSSIIKTTVVGAALILLMGVAPIEALAEPFETIVNNGNSQNRLDIAILGDGYTAGQLQKYKNDAHNLVQGFFGQTPFLEYQTYFNVHRIDVVSNQSGADHPERTPPFFVDTALDAAYNCLGIQRLICIDSLKVHNIVSNTLTPAQSDLVFVVVNDPEYGGSGGTFAVTSTNGAVIELILHEEGHSLGLLADEYGGPPPPTCENTIEPTAVNATKQTIRSLIKWNHWIDPATPIPTTSTSLGVPGLYEGAKYCDSGLFRPTFASKMRSQGFPFEQINSEQLIKRVYNFVSPLDSSTPSSNGVNLIKGQMQQFTASTPQPLSHFLTLTWFVDGQPQGTGSSFNLDSSALSVGEHSVTVSVRDPTTMVRSDPNSLLMAQRVWSLRVDAASTPTPTPTPTPAPPMIIVEQGTNRAAAVNAVTFVRGPFTITDNLNFSNDHRTRVMFFTTNLGVTQPDSQVLSVQAAGVPLPVENAGLVTTPGLDASYVIVRLPDGLPSGDLPLTVTLRGVASSNSPILLIAGPGGPPPSFLSRLFWWW